MSAIRGWVESYGGGRHPNDGSDARTPKQFHTPNYLRSFDAALKLLPDGADWTRPRLDTIEVFLPDRDVFTCCNPNPIFALIAACLYAHASLQTFEDR